jgi:hypothetical protein
MEDLSGKPEQMFAIMLKERIDVLEDTLADLRKEVEELRVNAGKSERSLFHYFIISLNDDNTFSEDKYDNLPQHVIDSCLDEIFKNRHIYEPTFAVWRVRGQSFHVAISLYKELSSQEMTELLRSEMYTIDNHKVLDFGLFKWLMYGDREFGTLEDDNDATFFPREGDAYMEYWWRCTTDFDTDIDLWPHMTQDPFTKSDNYGRSQKVQSFLKDQIYRCHNWSDLLRLHYIFM